MPTQSEFAKLWLYNNTTDKSELFSDFRDNLAGTKTSSSLQIIDGYLSDFNTKILNLENSNSSLLTVQATADVGSSAYVATVDNFTEYKTNMVMIAYFNRANSGLTTININNLSAKSIVKINGISGNTTALVANDILQNVGYILQYDGTQFLMLGEKNKEIQTSEDSNDNFPVGTLILLPDGYSTSVEEDGVSMMVKTAPGTYFSCYPYTKSAYVSFSDNQTLEAYKTANDTNITEIQEGLSNKINTSQIGAQLGVCGLNNTQTVDWKNMQVYFGYYNCSTPASVAGKTVGSIGSNYNIQDGSIVCINFANTNTAASPTLRVENLAAKPMVRADGTTVTNDDIASGRNAVFYYNNTEWVLLNPEYETNVVDYTSGGDTLTIPTIEDNREYYIQGWTSVVISSVPSSNYECFISIKPNSGSSTTLNLPDNIVWANGTAPTMTDSVVTEISIKNNYALFAQFPLS